MERKELILITMVEFLVIHIFMVQISETLQILKFFGFLREIFASEKK